MQLLAWSPTSPGCIARKAFPNMRSLAVAALPLHLPLGSNTIKSGLRSCCGFNGSCGCSRCRGYTWEGDYKELLVVGEGRRLRFVNPKTLRSVPVAVCRGSTERQASLRTEVSGASEHQEQQQQQQRKRPSRGLPIPYWGSGYILLVSRYCLVAVPRLLYGDFKFADAGRELLGESDDFNTSSSSGGSSSGDSDSASVSGGAASHSSSLSSAGGRSSEREGNSEEDSSSGASRDSPWEQLELLRNSDESAARIWPVLPSVSSNNTRYCGCCPWNFRRLHDAEHDNDRAAKGGSSLQPSLVRLGSPFRVAVGEAGASCASLSVSCSR